MEINPILLVAPMTAPDAARVRGSVELTRTVVAAVRALNKSGLYGEDRQLLFARDTETQQPVVRIVSRRTGEILEQMPPEELLKILADLTRSGEDGVTA